MTLTVSSLQALAKAENVLLFFLQIRGILIGFPYSGPRSEVTDWRMEATALGPVGRVRASLWFIGGCLLGQRGKVIPWERAKKAQAGVNGVSGGR